ncbi:SusC/RagA family TonB-linked outer membrane protein [Puia dinghuensis]|uniref:SusC/RagA family TonB-linked outer membrane protein n=1 Tax=Puia dinghuensis TaxID=1792502 RepID=A0A8J2U9Q5_9BACT|nr:SusC/RagA family TonB-linked outer membrane protein [Puia dinghuensis]GGA88371.1 SusC/RagA family TonB-linked outer membrane protein [Puia dinghuensis]
MRCTLRVLGIMLGVQAVCFATAHAQSTYAYARKNVMVTDQRAPDTDQPADNLQKATLFKVLKELNRTRGIYFLFSEQSLGTKLVNALPAGNGSGSIEKTLEQVLRNTGLKFKKVSDKTFVILYATAGNSASEARPVDFTRNMIISPVADNLITAPTFEPISGKIAGADGAPIAGVSVTVKGTKRGTSTNASGVFTIDAKKGDVLVVSYVGYKTQEVVVGDGDLAITLQASDLQLNEVVVTALGIQHKAKDLTYATQKLANSDLTTVKDANFVNSLTGKVAGVTITKSASGLGGSARVVLRGNKSTQNNQPLYVIDGIPLANYSPAQPTDAWGQSSGAGTSGRDGGDGISNLNPDDIESVTILKGASGAALYGSAAANGVIVITTKSGKAGRTRINVSSDLTAEKPMYYPDLQFKYGQGLAGVAATDTTNENSWGPVVNAPDHVKPFFNTGLTEVTTVSLAGGTEKSQTYFSYGNTSSKGIEPTASFIRHIFNFRETAKFLNDRLTADANLNFVDQEADNRPVSGLYANPLTGLELFPRGRNFDQYKNNYQYFSVLRNTNLQNWFDINYEKGFIGQDHEQNPYWILNRMPRIDKRDRVIANLSLKFKLLDWLNIQARGNVDKSWDIFDSRFYAGTQSVQSAPNGRYSYANDVNTQLYGDVILMANKNLTPDWNLQVNLGSSINDTKLADISFDTNPNDAQGLWFANKFGLPFITPSALVSQQFDQKTQQQAVFGSAELGFKQYLYFDVTGRNDWSSTFAFTPTKNSGYFYYSAGANFILSDAVHLPEAVTFAKVRISYARVGNAVSIYSTNPPQNTINNQTGSVTNTKTFLPGTYLKPEDNRSFEAGTEWRFLRDRVGVDVTYYKNNNYRQYMEIPAPLGSGYQTYYLNLGNIQNTGVEATAFVVPVQTRKFKWTSTINFAANQNRVIQLSDANVPGAGPGNAFILSSAGVNMYQSEIKQGGQWGDIYGYMFKRNTKDGTIMVNHDGSAIKLSTVGGSDSLGLVGNPNPKYTLGWNNSFDIDRFSVSLLIDGRFGGKVLSMTQAVLDEYGDSKASGAARDAGGVNIKATDASTGTTYSGLIPAQTFYKSVGDRNGLTEFYMYSATAVRLRELSIGYSIPTHVSWINSLKVAVIGRNLFFFHKDAPFDPETSMSTGNSLQGIETFSQPSTRSIGASVKVAF